MGMLLSLLGDRGVWAVALKTAMVLLVLPGTFAIKQALAGPAPSTSTIRHYQACVGAAAAAERVLHREAGTSARRSRARHRKASEPADGAVAAGAGSTASSRKPVWHRPTGSLAPARVRAPRPRGYVPPEEKSPSGKRDRDRRTPPDERPPDDDVEDPPPDEPTVPTPEPDTPGDDRGERPRD